MRETWEAWLLRNEGYTSRVLSDEDLEKAKEAEEYAERFGLEWVGKHGYYNIFYDPKEGKYYDRNKDTYLEIDDVRAMGLIT